MQNADVATNIAAVPSPDAALDQTVAATAATPDHGAEGRSASVGLSAPSFFASDLGLPDDVSQDAAMAYYDIALRFARSFDDWKREVFPYAIVDPADHAAVAKLQAEFERAERSGHLDKLSQQYLNTWRATSVGDANEFLVTHVARKMTLEIATGPDFEDHRTKAGFPRPSDQEVER